MSRSVGKDKPAQHIDSSEEEEDSEEESHDGSPLKSGGMGDDDEFEFAQEYTAQRGAGGGGAARTAVDKPFDEVHELSESNDDSQSNLSPSVSPAGKAPIQQQQQRAPSQQGRAQQQHHDDSDDSDASPSHHMRGGAPGGPKPGSQQSSRQTQQQQQQQPQKVGSSSEEEDDSDDESEESSSAAGMGGSVVGGVAGQSKLYNPADYSHLVVSSEIKDLFDYIGRHKPADIELETRMKPFIPDYIPAIGEIDAFLKVPPPDDSKDNLGLVVLDEPAAVQSDPTVMELSLRAVNKQVISQQATVRSIEHADKAPKKITKWIQSIEEVHRKKPPPVVHYSRPMPDVEQLMQAWPGEFEEMLQSTPLPSAELDLPVDTFAKMVCAIMDIPVHDGKIIESLHALFTLYAEFKNNSHFQH